MIKRLLTVFLVITICIFTSISVSAYTDQYIFDYGNALSYEEVQELESIAEQIENEYDYCVMFCITDEKTENNYAQNIYDAHTDNENGIVFVHDTERETVQYYVTESAGSVFNFIEMQDAYNSNNSYFGGIENYYKVVENMFDDTVLVDVDTDTYTTGDTTVSSKSPAKTIILCIVVGMAMGFIIILAIASKNKSVRMQTNATVYTRPGSFVVTGSYDNFLYKNLDKTPKPKQENKN